MEEKGFSDSLQTISLKNFAQLTGLPEQVIVKELLLEDTINLKGQIPLASLRQAMVKYLASIANDK